MHPKRKVFEMERQFILSSRRFCDVLCTYKFGIVEVGRPFRTFRPNFLLGNFDFSVNSVTSEFSTDSTPNGNLSIQYSAAKWKLIAKHALIFQKIPSRWKKINCFFNHENSHSHFYCKRVSREPNCSRFFNFVT